ncbi:hypothetical protein CBR_g54651 [Chara braunii]|uniref:Uncharacterized protein n=1 Tax=Chara braunii TaxID=69332 RepID=A0A388MCB5_CHABU|nr:hypothetical protein CBR_g54651 [Chara braunii]|eukprot:GBG92206.1 hypothetical protein CBR_g54651 [Chara braunii]
MMAVGHFCVLVNDAFWEFGASDGELVDDGNVVEGEGLLEFGGEGEADSRRSQERFQLGGNCRRLCNGEVVVLGERGGGMTMVEVVVDEGGGMDDMLAERTEDVEEEVSGVDVEAGDGGRVMESEVEEGAVVVTTWMVEEACCCSMVVIRSEKPDNRKNARRIF